MGLINKQTVPLLGVWRMEESVEELLALLDRPEEQADFLRRVTAEGRRREHLASRVLLKQSCREEDAASCPGSGSSKASPGGPVSVWHRGLARSGTGLRLLVTSKGQSGTSAGSSAFERGVFGHPKGPSRGARSGREVRSSV